jgi:hypothetical protein
MTAVCLENDGRQIAAQKLAKLVFDVCNGENPELDAIYQLQLSLLRSRCGRHDCRCLRDVTWSRAKRASSVGETQMLDNTGKKRKKEMQITINITA